MLLKKGKSKSGRNRTIRNYPRDIPKYKGKAHLVTVSWVCPVSLSTIVTITFDKRFQYIKYNRSRPFI